MTKFLIAADEFAPFMANRPGVLLVGWDQDAAAFAEMGLEVWYGHGLSAGSAAISRTADKPAAEALVELPVSPAGIMAVLCGAKVADQTWRAWFKANQGERAPEFVTGDAPSAMRAIAARLLADRARVVEECADLHLALSRLRQDCEQMETVSSGLVRALGHRATGDVKLLVSADPSDAAIKLNPAHPILTQKLGMRVDGLAVVAVMVLRAKLEPDDALRVRLSGVESGRVFGSWLVPADALVAGWLSLELPTPVAWAPETAQIELHLAAGKGAALELAKDQLAGFADNLPCRPGDVALDKPLALRIWSAGVGSRYVAPDFWDASEVGGSAHPAGVPLALPLGAWARVRVLQGEAAPQYCEPDETGAMVVGLVGGRYGAVLFPLIASGGMDVIEAVFNVRGGDVRNLAVALWLQPLGHKIESEADLLTEGPDVAWSGWHAFGSKSSLARVVMDLPPTTSNNLQLVVVLDATSLAGAGFSMVEIGKIILYAMNAGRKARRRAVVIDAKRDVGNLVPRSLNFTPQELIGDEPLVSLRDVFLDEHFDNGSSYRHLDMRLAKLAIGDYYWPALKFRLVVNNGKACLEFRDLPGWPPSLTSWPLAITDNYGRLTRLFGSDVESAALRDQAAPQDLALIQGLVACLPGLAAKAAALGELDAADCANWADVARLLVLRLAK